MPLIQTMIPYADDRNLGRAHNAAMALLPEGAWGCLLDHDVMFTTPDWHRQLSAAIKQYPEGCFSGVTNRIKCPFQQVAGVDVKNHDYAYHRAIGARLRADSAITDVTVTEKNRTPAGFLMLLSKAAWREAGGFPEGLHYLDRMMWLALKMAGRRVYIINGLYLYHWHRGAGEPIQAGEWVTRHKILSGKVLKLEAKPEDLPKYDGKTVFAGTRGLTP